MDEKKYKRIVEKHRARRAAYVPEPVEDIPAERIPGVHSVLELFVKEDDE